MKVGHATFKIQWLTDEDWYKGKEDDDWGGVTKHEEQVILVRCSDGRAEDSLRETLLHEIIHAVWSTRGLNHFPMPADPDDLEEYIVTCQTPGLLTALAENPDVLAYLINLGEPAA